MLDSVRGLHVVLLIGLACVIQTSAHYCYTTNATCTYNHQNVDCYNLDEFPELPVRHDFPVFYLTIWSGNITTITKENLLSGLGVIKLYHNPLTHMADDAFDLSASSLMNLVIKDARFDTLPRALTNLTGLFSLHIEDTPIQRWENSTLRHISLSVFTLILRNVNLFSWPPWISSFSTLSELDLSYNPLISIRRDAFNSLTNTLIHLTLIGTGLVYLPLSISRLPHLRYLTLNENNFTEEFEMTRLSASSFSQRLQIINMSASGISRIANFSNFTNLHQIDFSCNRISSVPSGLLPSSLTHLQLSYNNLGAVPYGISTFSLLFKLYLKGNQITQVRHGDFPSSLTDLDLSHNNISNITTAFKNLFSLKDLLLNNNPITEISTSAFGDLHELTLLSLEQTHLTEIPMALTLLPPQVIMLMTTVQLLTCPCPTNQELVQWYASLHSPRLNVSYCTTGQSINLYLTDPCF